MRKVILTLAIAALSVLAFGQKKQKKVSDSTLLIYNGSPSLNQYIKEISENNSIIFYGDSVNPILIFKSNGDIIYKGRKLATDTAIVNGLRKAFTGERRVK